MQIDYDHIRHHRDRSIKTHYMLGAVEVGELTEEDLRFINAWQAAVIEASPRDVELRPDRRDKDKIATSQLMAQATVTQHQTGR